MNEALKAYRAAESLSQRQLAEIVGTCRETVARWETGARKIDVKLVPVVCRATGIPVNKLRPDLFPEGR